MPRAQDIHRGRAQQQEYFAIIKMSTVHKRRTCVIIGAGVSGLVQAAELVRHRVLKHEQISILERADDYGGVWTAATYVNNTIREDEAHDTKFRSLEQLAMCLAYSTRSAGSRIRVSLLRKLLM